MRDATLQTLAQVTPSMSGSVRVTVGKLGVNRPSQRQVRVDRLRVNSGHEVGQIGSTLAEENDQVTGADWCACAGAFTRVTCCYGLHSAVSFQIERAIAARRCCSAADLESKRPPMGVICGPRTMNHLPRIFE